MNEVNYKITELSTHSKYDMNEFRRFLTTHGMSIDSELEFIAAIIVDDQIVATGAVSGNVLKLIAVHPDYQGSGLTNKIVTELISYQYSKDLNNFFIYTKPENRIAFESLGFCHITTIKDTVCLLEMQKDGISSYLDQLSLFRRDAKNAGAVVVNCNPFTLGHRYLIEQAASQCDALYVFVVEEDRSVFPTHIRYDLVSKGVMDITHAKVFRAGNYIISQATFPSYFYKDKKMIVDAHARLDVNIFVEKIAPTLGIKHRFVGSEPYCPVTDHYNNVMKQVLPLHGISLTVLDRKMKYEKAISASHVRSLISEGRLEEVRDLVPDTTYNFLLSEAGKKICTKIKGETNENS